MASGYSPVDGGGLQRTDMHCHECGKNFVAELDFDLNGDHSIICPICSHEHCRVIKDGVITGDRWSSTNGKVHCSSTWQSGILKMKTSTVSSFIRDRWLNRSDFNGC